MAVLASSPTAAATTAGDVLTFGGDSFGQLGNGAAGAHWTRTGPVLTAATDVAGGREHVLALLGGEVYAWGSDQKGQVGNGSPLANVASPQPVLTGAQAITTGHYHSLALLSSGSVRAWGWNAKGQVGPGGGGSSNVAAPVTVTGFPSPVVAIAAGRAHSLAILSDGTVWSWGDNSSGQLGYGIADTARHPVPAPVRNLPSGIVHIAGGRDTSFAITASGDLWAWGNSQYGQVGNGTIGVEANGAPRLVLRPVLVSTGTAVVESGADHVISVRMDGSVWTWGRNRFGQLGYPGTQNRSRPTRVLALPASRLAFAGRDHNIVLALDGRVFTFGRNDGGQLGLDPALVPSTNVPRELVDLAGARDAGGGQVYSVVVG